MYVFYIFLIVVVFVGGVCGYGNFYSMGYGINIVVLSLVFFNSGFFCGVCYEFICDSLGFKYCNFGNLLIVFIVINYCF